MQNNISQLFFFFVQDQWIATKLQKKRETKKEAKPKFETKKQDVNEVILPNLNLKTETVLNLFKDVKYDLGKVRSQKLVKPIYNL